MKSCGSGWATRYRTLNGKFVKDMKNNMKVRFILFLFLMGFLEVPTLSAQAPKWVEKAKETVFSIITYDADDKMLNTGNGFFVTEDGVALSDYTLFKGAQRAVAVDSKGKQMPVQLIMGADDMYDVIKFKVGIPGKKVPALSLATVAPQAGMEVFLLPYSTRKDRSCTTGKVKAADAVEGSYLYYTLDMRLPDKMVSCPLMTAEGEVFGLAQKSSGQDTATVCYAVDARYAMAREIAALSYSDLALKGVGIKKALPDTEEQALVFLYMVSSQLPADEYMVLLGDFIAQYPDSPDGYLRRATQQLLLSQDEASLAKVDADLDKALDVAREKEDVYYNRAKTMFNYLATTPDASYKEWTFDAALQEIRSAIAINSLPLYVQLEGDILFAKQDYPAALACYEKVNASQLASAETFYSTAKTKELMKAPVDEVLALMDSCMAYLTTPYAADAAPYLLERARVRVEAGKARDAVQDYNAYYDAVNGQVNDVFYYWREQAALKARLYQIALDDLAKAIELAPNDLTYRAELAVVNIRVNRCEEALAVLQAALDIDPNYAEAYRLMGLAQVQLKRREDACASFSKAKELGHPQVDDLIQKYCK